MRRTRLLLSGLFLGVVCLFAAQADTAVKAGASQSKSVKAGASQAKSVKADYVLQPQDLIRIEIFQEDDLKREVRISGEFTVKLPLIDTVYLKDKTARQAEEHIRDLYGREYLAKPQVNLFVLEYAPQRVFIAGAVVTPGVVLFLQEQGLTLIGAILSSLIGYSHSRPL